MNRETRPQWAKPDATAPEPEPASAPRIRPTKPGPAQKAKPAKRDSSTMILLLIAGMVAIGGIAFAAGRVTAPTAAAAAVPSGALGFGNFPRGSLAPGQTFNPAGGFGGGLGRGGVGGGLGSGVTGTVQSISGSTLTLLLSTGSTVTIDLSGSTTYHNETAGSSSDVKVGTKVQVQIETAAAAGATPNPSGSGDRTITASDILIVP